MADAKGGHPPLPDITVTRAVDAVRSSPSSTPSRKRTRLTPPFRFGTVEDGVYRSAQPTPHNYDFVLTLGLRTIVSVVAKVDSGWEAFVSHSLLVAACSMLATAGSVPGCHVHSDSEPS